ncbi:hypothetical protein ES332_D13G110600v1 [Gossypium tomentosum]|uniref:Uncharacterized protein n=1 Tax=Gossypium tomentosum TaxID=34277 RepID=A0A5D2HX88_GOSTO|nr:hypothetical protein ES332_D13G110600v1 [Gossypium tomentosum]
MVPNTNRWHSSLIFLLSAFRCRNLHCTNRRWRSSSSLEGKDNFCLIHVSLIPDLLTCRLAQFCFSIATPPDLEAWTRRAEIMKCCDKVKKYDKVNNSWSIVKRLPVRADSSYGWGLAFKACGNSLLVIGAGGHGGHDDGVIVLHSWNPDEGNRDGQEWNVLAVNAQAGTFVYNCAVMGC